LIVVDDLLLSDERALLGFSHTLEFRLRGGLRLLIASIRLAQALTAQADLTLDGAPVGFEQRLTFGHCVALLDLNVEDATRDSQAERDFVDAAHTPIGGDRFSDIAAPDGRRLLSRLIKRYGALCGTGGLRRFSA
jgi:hypothetical protein